MSAVPSRRHSVTRQGMAPPHEVATVEPIWRGPIKCAANAKEFPPLPLRSWVMGKQKEKMKAETFLVSEDQRKRGVRPAINGFPLFFFSRKDAFLSSSLLPSPSGEEGG